MTLSVESKLTNLGAVRAALAGVYNDLRIPGSELYLIQLAVTEILSNAIEHGYQGAPGGRIDISVHQTGQVLCIHITDDAPLFSPDKLQKISQADDNQGEPDESWSERGHGLQIARRAVDSLKFGRSGQRNCVTLTKQIFKEQD